VLRVGGARLGLRRGVGAAVLRVVRWRCGASWRAAAALSGLSLLPSRTVAVARSG